MAPSSLQLSCEQGFVKRKHRGLKTRMFSLHTMGRGALQGLAAAAQEVTDQGTHRDIKFCLPDTS